MGGGKERDKEIITMKGKLKVLEIGKEKMDQRGREEGKGEVGRGQRRGRIKGDERKDKGFRVRKREKGKGEEREEDSD